MDLMNLNMNKLFVYGILLDQYPNVEARLHGYTLHHYGHATIRKDDDCYVDGQLIEVDDIELDNIDTIEGRGHYYERFMVEVETDNGFEDCWVYQQIRDMEHDGELN
jgi:gamma-glutamylcyclotransferase (GGCT)/AIG2-like uncharacterized protein YtfP